MEDRENKRGGPMPIFLAQHGLSLSKAEDPERGLAPTGVEETRRIAEAARGYSVRPSAVFHSGKKRTRQTAEIFAEVLGIGRVEEIPGIAPLDPVEVFADTLAPGGKALYVGHLPFLDRLLGFLVTGDPEKSVFLFQNSGLLCAGRHPEQSGWAVRWALMPHILG